MNLPDPFKCAKRVPGVHVTLRPQDVMDVSACIGLEAAERFLHEHEIQIAAEMLAAGKTAAARIMHGGEES